MRDTVVVCDAAGEDEREHQHVAGGERPRAPVDVDAAVESHTGRSASPVFCLPLADDGVAKAAVDHRGSESGTPDAGREVLGLLERRPEADEPLGGDERAATERPGVELADDQHAARAENAAGFSECGVPVGEVVEGVDDQDRVDRCVSDGKPARVPTYCGQSPRSGASNHPRRGVDDDPRRTVDAGGRPTRAAGDVEQSLHRPVGTGEAVPERGGSRPGHPEVVEASEAVEESDVTRAVHGGAAFGRQ